MKICQQCRGRFGATSWQCPSCGWAAPRHGAISRLMPDEQHQLGFAARFFSDLTAVESRHFWFAARNALIAWALSRYCPDARTFLDVGCGTGQVIAALARSHPHLRLTGSEAFIEGLQLAARQVPAAELVQADARSLPYEAEFDGVGAFDVLEHIAEHEQAMSELARAVRPGGVVLVTVPQHPSLWSPVDEYSGHQRRYTRRGLVALVESAGLRVERVTSFVSLLMPALLLSRVAQRGKPVDPLTEYRVSPLVNRVGHAVMAMERGLIRAGTPLPAGGSLLSIARRPA